MNFFIPAAFQFARSITDIADDIPNWLLRSYFKRDTESHDMKKFNITAAQWEAEFVLALKWIVTDSLTQARCVADRRKLKKLERKIFAI